MTSCKHANLVLVVSRNRIRCVHCHLTITAEEIGGGCCPECYESRGIRRYDFEEMKTAETVRYRCEECGATITYERFERENMGGAPA